MFSKVIFVCSVFAAGYAQRHYALGHANPSQSYTHHNPSDDYPVSVQLDDNQPQQDQILGDFEEQHIHYAPIQFAPVQLQNYERHSAEHADYYSQPKFEFNIREQSPNMRTVKFQEESRDINAVKEIYSSSDTDDSSRISDDNTGYDTLVKNFEATKRIEPSEQYFHN